MSTPRTPSKRQQELLALKARLAERETTITSLDWQLQDMRQRYEELSQRTSDVLERRVRELTTIDEDLKYAMVSAGQMCGIPYIDHGSDDWPRAAAEEILRLREAIPKPKLGDRA